MTVLLVNRFYGGQQTPTGRMLEDAARVLVDRGHDVRVLTSAAQYEGAQATGEGAAGEVSVKRLWSAPGWPRVLRWGLFWLQACLRVPLMSWDRCVLLSDPPFLVVAALLSKAASTSERRVYWWPMDLYPEAVVAKGLMQEQGWADRLLRALNEAAFRHVDGSIALGERQVERLRTYRQWKQGGNEYVVVPPWDHRPLPRVAKADNRFVEKYGWTGRRIVLYAGNIGEAHAYKEALAAARVLEDTSPDWLFVFVVRGAKRTALEKEAAPLDNVAVVDYQPPELTADLLWAADVHLITMSDGWEGIVVPSKLYGALKTDAPVLFVGPTDADTASEITRRRAGTVLPSGSSGAKVAGALKALHEQGRGASPAPETSDAPQRVADFVSQAT